MLHSSDPAARTGAANEAAALQEQHAALRRLVLGHAQAHIIPDEAATQELRPRTSGGRGAARRPPPHWRGLLRRAGALAEFVGPELAATALVPALMWLPNESDWRTRAAFYARLPDLAASVVCSSLRSSLFPSLSFCRVLAPKLGFAGETMHALQGTGTLTKVTLTPFDLPFL